LRVQFHALIERCSRDGAEVVAKGFAARGRHPDGALALPRRICRGCGEAIRWSGKIFHSSRVLVRAMLRLRVQLLIDRLAAEDRGGFGVMAKAKKFTPAGSFKRGGAAESLDFLLNLA
jgi:hypothetical protein